MAEKQIYLFVCYANENRSPTAEAVCRRIAEQNSLEIEMISAGISRSCDRPLTREMAEKADRIFVMEDEIKVQIEQEYGQKPEKVICLGIPDLCVRNEPWLVRFLEDKLYEYFEDEGLFLDSL